MSTQSSDRDGQLIVEPVTPSVDKDHDFKENRRVEYKKLNDVLKTIMYPMLKKTVADESTREKLNRNIFNSFRDLSHGKWLTIDSILKAREEGRFVHLSEWDPNGPLAENKKLREEIKGRVDELNKLKELIQPIC